MFGGTFIRDCWVGIYSTRVCGDTQPQCELGDLRWADDDSVPTAHGFDLAAAKFQEFDKSYGALNYMGEIQGWDPEIMTSPPSGIVCRCEEYLAAS